MTPSSVDMLKTLHQMSSLSQEPEHANRKERRAAKSRKRKLNKKKLPRPNLARK